MTFRTKTIALTVVLSALAAPATAKGHDQGIGEAQGGPFTPTDPGPVDGTVAGAQGLGDALGGNVGDGGFSGAVRQDGKD